MKYEIITIHTIFLHDVLAKTSVVYS